MKKKVNIVLIVIVAVLWGSVGFRYFRNRQLQNNEGKLQAMESQKIKIAERDTFTLLPLSRDPFLNKVEPSYIYNQKVKYKKVNVSVKAKKIEVKPQVWPKIKYYGYIKTENNKEVAIIQINNGVHKLHYGETSQGIQIKKIFTKDSIALMYNSEIRNFKKK